MPLQRGLCHKRHMQERRPKKFSHRAREDIFGAHVERLRISAEPRQISWGSVACISQLYFLAAARLSLQRGPALFDSGKSENPMLELMGRHLAPSRDPEVDTAHTIVGRLSVGSTTLGYPVTTGYSFSSRFSVLLVFNRSLAATPSHFRRISNRHPPTLYIGI